jgi:hypothetical protein
LLGLLLGPPSPASPRSRAPHRAAFSASRPFGFDRFSNPIRPLRANGSRTLPLPAGRADEESASDFNALDYRSRPTSAVAYAGFCDATAGWALGSLRYAPLERSSGPKARFPPEFEAEMPSPFASSSRALSAAEACGATLEAVLRSRNLKELFGSIQQGRYCDATAHRP